MGQVHFWAQTEHTPEDAVRSAALAFRWRRCLIFFELTQARVRFALERHFGAKSLQYDFAAHASGGKVVLNGATTDEQLIVDAVRLLQGVERVHLRRKQSRPCRLCSACQLIARASPGPANRGGLQSRRARRPRFARQDAPCRDCSVIISRASAAPSRGRRPSRSASERRWSSSSPRRY